MLRDEDAVTRLKEILTAEGVEWADGVLESVLSIADGDLRRAITLLQSAARLVGAGSASNGTNGKSGRKQILDEDDEDEQMPDVNTMFGLKQSKITVELIDELAGVIPGPIIEELVSAMRKGPGRNYKVLSKLVEDLVASGFSANEVLSSLFSRLIHDEEISDVRKNKLTQIFSELDKRLIDGVDEHMAALDLVLQCSGIMAK
jgi:DNA polymerase III delta prime subunit